MSRKPRSQDPDIDAPEAAFSSSGREVRLNEDDFWKRVAAEKDPDAFQIYVYRLWPIIDQHLTGKKHTYIDKASGADLASREHLLKRWGSGKYHLRANHHTNGVSHSYRVMVKINDPDILPKVDPVTLVRGHEENVGFEEQLKMRGLLEGNVNDSQTVDKLANKLVDLAQQVAEAKSAPAASVPEPPRAEPSALNNAYVQGMQSLFEMQGKLMDRMMKSNPQPEAQPQKPFVEQVGEFFNIAEKMGFRRAGGVPGGGSGGVSWVGDFMRHVPEMLQSTVEIIRFVALMRSAGAAVPGPAVHPAAGLAVLPTTPDPMTIPGGEETMAGISFSRLQEIGRQAISAFERGKTGDQFADALVTMADDGESAYEALAGIGLDGIMQALKMLPAWPQLEPKQAEIEAFIKTFIEWGSEEEGQAA